MHTLSSSLLLPLLASAVAASQCRGTCKTLLRADEKNIPGVLHIDGPSHLVSDLSARAGWEILDCPPKWDRGYVDVRLVCTTENPEATCHHVHEEGAEHTIVRLPDSCGAGPFARVAQWSTSDDQSVPAGSRADVKLRRRNLTPEVYKARLDYNFGAIPVERGTVSFDLSAAHHPDIAYDVKKTGHVARALREATGHPAYQSGEASADNILGIDLPDIDLPDVDLPDVDLPDVDLPDVDLPDVDLPDVDLPDIDLPDVDLPDVGDLNTFDTMKSKGFEVMKTKFNKTLVDESLGCNFGKIGFSQSAKIGLDTDITLNAGYAFKMVGQLVPPDVKEFGVAGAMSGSIAAEFSVDMYLSADILFPPLKIFGVGIPGLFVPGIITLGPEAVLQVQFDLVLDVAFAAKIPLKYDFERLDFSFPDTLVKNGASGQASKKTSSLELNASPGDQTGSFGIHLVPKLEFGAEILSDLAHAEVYVGIDLDATFNSNGTIFPDWSYTGCQDFSVGALAKAGVSAGALKILSIGDYIPLYEKRHTVWSHCSKQEDGPASAVYDNGDGTFSNAGGDLVNENGQLIDDKGEVIPDADAEDAAPPPIKGEDGNPIPEEDLILDNGDGTFDDAQGNPVNQDGQRISPNGTVMACDLDTSQPMLDADGNAIPPEEVVVEVGEGLYSNNKCDLVNEDGQLVNADGVVIDFEPFKDENGTEIASSEVVIDMEDGTYMDAYGNAVDQWGGALDFDEEGNVIPVELTPVEEEDDTQEEREPTVDTDPDFKIMTPEELEALALALINGSAPALPESPADPATSIPPPSTEPPTSTEAPPASTDAPSTEVPPTTSTDAPSTDAPPTTSSDTPSSTETSDSGAPTLNPNPIPIPSGVPTCKASARKRSLASKPSRPRPTQISLNLRRKRSILGKRSGFGCSMPSIGGLPIMPATVMEDLGRMF